jgi:preprotein translocase subunit SecG
MKVTYYVLIGISAVIAVFFSLLVLITGKGDAMSGGGGVRTTFKGKASFDDLMSKWTLILGATWMAIMLVIDVISSRLSQGPH